MSTVRRALLRASLAALILIAVGPVAGAGAAPGIAIVSPSNGSYTSNQLPLFSGATDDTADPLTLDIYEGTFAAGVPAEMLFTPFAPSGGTWELTPILPLPSGTYTAVAEQTELASAETGMSAPVTFTVDTIAPIVSVNPVDSPTSDPSPTFTGSAGAVAGDEAEVSVTVYQGGSVGGAVAVSKRVSVGGGASWVYTPSSQLADGAYTVQAAQSDAAGNVGLSAPVTFTVDTTAPVVSLNAVGSPTNDATPTLGGGAGTAEGDESTVAVTVYHGDSVGGGMAASASVPVGGGALWSYVLSSSLADGTYTAQVTQNDAAGNQGVSAPVTFKVDTTPPVLEVATPINNAFLNSSRPTFSGSAGNASGDRSSITLNIYTGASASGSPAQTFALTRTGASWSTGSSGPQLADGLYTVQATQSDSAGNTGTSSPQTFTIKTNPPVVTLNPVGSITNDPTQNFSGSADTSNEDSKLVTVKLYDGGSSSGKLAQAPMMVFESSDGSWSAGPTQHLGDGAYTAQAEQEDFASNTGVSLPVTFTVDTTPPALSLAAPASSAFLKSPQPTFSGSAGNATGDSPSVLLSIYTGASASGSPLQALTIARSGASWTTGSTGPQLPDGVYTAQATQSDAAGNTGTSGAHTFTIKTNSPVVTLNTPRPHTKDATPSFSGTADTKLADDEFVTLQLYSGVSATGKPKKSYEAAVTNEGLWSTGPIGRLADGVYTVQAEQQDRVGHTGVSLPYTFTVDTVVPVVTLRVPADGSATSSATQPVNGSAGTAEGDVPTVIVRLFSGSSVGQEGSPSAQLESIEVGASDGVWSTAFAELTPGIYTARAEQADEAGNLGLSSTSTFTVTAPHSGPSTPNNPSGVSAQNASPTPGPPAASFTWIPSAPTAGRSISLVSNSTDAGSPITVYAWDVADKGIFTAGPQVLSTSFSTPGSHIVRLRVTDAAGASSIATETIEVSPARAPLMQPFPVVRIAGSDTFAGVRLSLLTVQAPTGARVTVRCRNRGCPTSSESSIARASGSRRGTALVTFRRFESSLRAGVVLEIRVWKRGEIGKYTRFSIRRGKPPVRVDECLAPAGVKPMTCPSS
jgi:large repetitive protein